MALQAVLSSERPEWEVKLVNLQEVLDSLDIFRKLTGIRLEDMYNLALAKGWTLGSEYLLPLMHGVIRLYHPAQVRLLTELWKTRLPDMVVSLVPNFNRALFQSLASASPGVPLVTIMTDFADYPPHFWMEKQAQYLICGTNWAKEQARAIGYADARVFRTSGMILRPPFYLPQTSDARLEREKLGLDPDLPTGLVMFGGEGSNVMLAIAERLGGSALDLQLIMICGRNEHLQQRLRRYKTKNRLHIEGFTKEIPHFMHIADFFVGKPGPGSISEAIKMKLPVIVERNSWTLPQERFNADWVTDEGVGLVLNNFREIENAVKNLLSDGRLQAMSDKAAALDNRAVFEIPVILEQILQRES
jgi:1,2-diacylglycerol 3-beta-galactosyltransferase